MHGRKYCTSCGPQTNRLNIKSFVKAPIVLILATNQCHNKLPGKLTRTCLDIPQILGNGMYITGNHENMTPSSNYILSETIQHMVGWRNRVHFLTKDQMGTNLTWEVTG